MTDDEVSQYLVHPALRERLDAWLISQGFRVDRVPPEFEGEDSLPTYLVAPSDMPQRPFNIEDFIGFGSPQAGDEQKPELGGAVGRRATFACAMGEHDLCDGDAACHCRCHE